MNKGLGYMGTAMQVFETERNKGKKKETASDRCLRN
jgi:hypothetical protein